MADAFFGEIRAFAFDYMPEGWIFCDGRQLTVNQYQILYAILGNIYGGTSGITFNLPDLRGLAPVPTGISTSTGITTQIGQVYGQKAITLNAGQMPLHTHQAKGVGALAGQTLSDTPSATSWPAITRYPSGNVTYDSWTTESPSIAMHPSAIGPAGGNPAMGGAPDAHSNISPYLTVNFCICNDGIFPVKS